MIVGTPIGNLGDLSPRALDALGDCDFIAAEDTRVTVKILNHFGLKKPMVSYFEHNRFEKGDAIAARIIGGEVCALVTDAGMPAVSDPGEDLVRLCHKLGIKVEVIPGPSAFVAALAVSGMPAGRFTFEGFLSVNKLNRREHIRSLLEEKRTMIFYEAPHKLPSTLKDLAAAFGEREVAIVRELTKIYEEVILTTLPLAAQKFAQEKLKGEIVLVIEGAPTLEEEPQTLESAVETAHGLIKEGLSLNEAAKQAAKQSGQKKGDIYKMLHQEE
ncbi:MAG TPA: 16S rRNA (cytidine(1402)-2'-O)-methyltransferase [Clostridia bacterium]|nr:16S rRNA (cytidine(1402)-2'-O)-methyltransferase [Clostridia bacterium]